jgi:thiosulfate dehydrogenase
MTGVALSRRPDASSRQRDPRFFILNSQFFILLLLSGCSAPPPAEQPAPAPPAPITGTQLQGYTRTYELAGPLVPASTTMASAWDIPANPLTDGAMGTSAEADLVRRGYRLFTDTPYEASRLTHNRLSCNNCHLNAGQRELSLPLVGVDAMFPEYNKRAGRDFTLEERIVGCFMRSENATGGTETPEPDAPEVTALAAYLRWLSRGYPKGENPSWRKRNRIADDKLMPIDRLDPVKGETIYREKCQSCHGIDGQGVQIGDKKAGPLWGPESWNDGAGAARTYTLAGIVRYAMPYLSPGSLTDEEAQHVAAFITSKPRPVYPFKDQDYLAEPVPPDAVYYKR